MAALLLAACASSDPAAVMQGAILPSNAPVESDRVSLPAQVRSLDRGQPIAAVAASARSGSPTLPPPPASTTAVVPLPEDWRLVIPDIDVDAPMVSVGFDNDGAMGVPEGPVEVGWFRYGAAPGQQGNALLDGHVDWTDRQTGIPRGAVFWHLARLSVGSMVIVRSGDREFTYAVTEKRRYRWDDPEGVSVLQPTTDARITLITCGGVFDRSTRNYSMREVVIAQLQ